jgi:hypothetical protein
MMMYRTNKEFLSMMNQRDELKEQNAALLEALECNNDLLLNLSREMLIREDYRSTVVADQIRDNYEAIRKAKGE